MGHKQSKAMGKLLDELPGEIAQLYKRYESKPKEWQRHGDETGANTASGSHDNGNGGKTSSGHKRAQGGAARNTYFSRQLPVDSKEYKQAMQLFEQLGGGKIPVTDVVALYNPRLVTSFINQRSFFQDRLDDLHALTNEQRTEKLQPWRLNDPNGMKEWVHGVYQEMLQRFSWNSTAQVPILPTVHGTGMSVAWKIAESGFVSLASLDAGYFGQGIYFTSSALYALPYARQKEDPAIVVSFVMPGNIYPVTENHKGEDTLMGAPIKQPGYNSHYAITTQQGDICSKPQTPCFDELVIEQEAQIVPAFIFKLDPTANLHALYHQFERQVPSSPSPRNSA